MRTVRERPFAAWRRAAGLDLDRAAIRIGCSVGHLRSIERSRVPLSIRLAGKMARAYNCSISQLFQLPHQP